MQSTSPEPSRGGHTPGTPHAPAAPNTPGTPNTTGGQDRAPDADVRVAGQTGGPPGPGRHKAPERAGSPEHGSPEQGSPEHGTREHKASPGDRDQAQSRPEEGARSDARPTAGAFPPPAAARPGSSGDGTGATGGGRQRLLDDAQADGFRDRWHRVQSGFVDDPSDAVRHAEALAGEVVNTLGQALTARKRALDEATRRPGEDGEAPDTESLRQSMRAYRDFVNRMLAL